MRRAVLTHPKLYELGALLNCSRPCAIGYLTLLWDFTAEHSPCGDIGRWPDGAIARACEWQSEPGKFIEALVTAGWVDQDKNHRLLIHDWSAHCERWVELKLKKLEMSFAVATVEASIEASIERPSPSPSPSPVLSKDNGQQVDRDIGFEKFWKLYPKHVKKRESKKVWHAKRLETDLQTILDDIRNRSALDRRWKEGFIPDPPTYLRGERWCDEIDRSVKPVETWKLTDAQLISKCAQVGISTVGRSRAMLQAELDGKG